MNINIQKELRRIETNFNSMVCPDCGGLHQCHLHCNESKSIKITFAKGLLGEPCWGYKSMLHQAVKELEKMMYEQFNNEE